MTTWEKFVNMLKGQLTSRKFWALLTALLAVAAGYFTGELSVWQAVQAIVGALSGYAGFVALEDGLSRRG